MTLERCVELLRELHALDRTRAALALHGTDPDWTYVLTMLSDRVYLLRAALSVEDPALIGDALDVVQEERQTLAEKDAPFEVTCMSCGRSHSAVEPCEPQRIPSTVH